MGKREALLLGAGLIILTLVLWRENQLATWSNNPARAVVVTTKSLAPRFMLPDQHRKIVKLERLLGRHRVVLVFFDAELGIDGDPRTKSLIENFPAIHRMGVEIIAVGTSTPFANAEAQQRLGTEVPFPVLTDIDMNNPAPTPAHRNYGRIDPHTEEPLTGLFLIERDGSVAIDSAGVPFPVTNERTVLSQLAEGIWPRGE